MEVYQQELRQKDVILKIIGTIGTAGGTGYVIEFAGEVIRNSNVEQRMTICNMTIEAGARAGLIAPDDKGMSTLKIDRCLQKVKPGPSSCTLEKTF